MTWNELSGELSFGRRKKKKAVKQTPPTREEYEQSNRGELSAMCRSFGLPSAGKKDVLISRLLDMEMTE